MMNWWLEKCFKIWFMNATSRKDAPRAECMHFNPKIHIFFRDFRAISIAHSCSENVNSI